MHGNLSTPTTALIPHEASYVSTVRYIGLGYQKTVDIGTLNYCQWNDPVNTQVYAYQGATPSIHINAGTHKLTLCMRCSFSNWVVKFVRLQFSQAGSGWMAAIMTSARRAATQDDHQYQITCTFKLRQSRGERPVCEPWWQKSNLHCNHHKNHKQFMYMCTQKRYLP